MGLLSGWLESRKKHREQERQWRKEEREREAEHRSEEVARGQVIHDMLARGFLSELPYRYEDGMYESKFGYNKTVPFRCGEFTFSLTAVIVDYATKKPHLGFYIGTDNKEFDFIAFNTGYFRERMLWIPYERIDGWKTAVIQELDKIVIKQAEEYEKIRKLAEAISDAVNGSIEAQQSRK